MRVESCLGLDDLATEIGMAIQGQKPESGMKVIRHAVFRIMAS